MTGPLSWIEVSRSALLANWALFRAQAGPERVLLPVLKANAYGHGLELVGRLLAEAGQQWFGVHGRRPWPSPRCPPCAPKLPALGRAGRADWELAAAGARLTLIDREGPRPRARPRPRHDLPCTSSRDRRQPAGFRADQRLAAALAASPRLVVEGVHSHFANIEDTTDHSYARAQMERFTAMRTRLAALGVRPRLVHASCSAAAILFPETHHDLLRVGISLYGHWPSRETRVSAQAAGRNRLDLRAALTWKARIIQIKPVAAGAYVGYGCSWRAETATRLGVLPMATSTAMIA
jgi:alanine racemase